MAFITKNIPMVQRIEHPPSQFGDIMGSIPFEDWLTHWLTFMTRLICHLYLCSSTRVNTVMDLSVSTFDELAESFMKLISQTN